MKKMKKTTTSLLLAFVAAIASFSSTLGLQPAEQMAVILIMDNSGSMKVSDPSNLRRAGVQMFASLLDESDAVGLILFSTRAEILIGMEEYQNHKDFWSGLMLPEPQGYTDIQSALKSAKEMISSGSFKGRKVVIVLLTDGKPEIQTPYPQYEQETIELAQSLDVPIMAIALTSAAQTPFLERLAKATKGSVVFADDSSDLIGAYLSILGQVKDRTVVGGEKFRSISTLDIEQTLAPYIRSATFVIAKTEDAQAALYSPGGQKIDEDKSPDARFSLVTLENPVGGTYTFRSQGKGEMQAWLILRSRLRAQIISPSAIHPAGEEMVIVVNLLEETSTGNYTKIIGEATFTALITTPAGKKISLDYFYDDGTHGDVTANDGSYTRLYPDTNQTGKYSVAVTGNKGAIPVEIEINVEVAQFPVLAIDAPTRNVEVRGAPIHLQVQLWGADSLGGGHVIARLTSPSGTTSELEMKGKDTYTASFLPLENGEYWVEYETRGAIYRGEKYQSRVEQHLNVSVIPFAQVLLASQTASLACLSNNTGEVSIVFAVTASDEGTLTLSASDEWEIKPEEIRVKKGSQNIRVSVRPRVELRHGIHQIEISIQGKDRLEILPEYTAVVEFNMPNIWTRCRVPIRWGEALSAVVVISVIMIKHKRKIAQPAPVSGTLRHWETGTNSAFAEDIDLTVFRKTALSIGSGATCDVMIPHAGLAFVHARMSTEKIPGGVEIFLEPIGEVRKGYSQHLARFSLRHGETFRMGNHDFQYLSDSGE